MLAQFNSAELNMLHVLLEELREKQSNAGCNDFSIEKTRSEERRVGKEC